MAGLIGFGGISINLLELYNEQMSRDERKIEQVYPRFDMDYIDLDHDSCWCGDPGIIPCCSLKVEFEKEHDICPFLWLKEK